MLQNFVIATVITYMILKRMNGFLFALSTNLVLNKDFTKT